MKSLRRTSKYKRSIDNAHIIAAEHQYSQLPYPLQPQLLGKQPSDRLNLNKNSILSTVIGLGVGSLIVYKGLSARKVRRPSNVVQESTLQRQEKILNDSIRKFSQIGKKYFLIINNMFPYY